MQFYSKKPRNHIMVALAVVVVSIAIGLVLGSEKQPSSDSAMEDQLGPMVSEDIDNEPVDAVAETDSPAGDGIPADENAGNIGDSGTQIGQDDEETPDNTLPDTNQNPVRLSTLEPYAVDGDYLSVIDKENIFGVLYHDVIFTSFSAGGENTYRIDGKYKKLTGTAFVDTKDKEAYGRITICGDGKELFSSNVYGGADNVDIDVDLSGVKDLKLSLEGPGNWDSMCFADATLIP